MYFTSYGPRNSYFERRGTEQGGSRIAEEQKQRGAVIEQPLFFVPPCTMRTLQTFEAAADAAVLMEAPPRRVHVFPITHTSSLSSHPTLSLCL